MAIFRWLGRFCVVGLVGCNALVGNETVKYFDKATEVNETVDNPGTSDPDTPGTVDPPPADDAGTLPPVGDDEDAGFTFDIDGGD